MTSLAGPPACRQESVLADREDEEGNTAEDVRPASESVRAFFESFNRDPVESARWKELDAEAEKASGDRANGAGEMGPGTQTPRSGNRPRGDRALRPPRTISHFPSGSTIPPDLFRAGLATSSPSAPSACPFSRPPHLNMPSSGKAASCVAGFAQSRQRALRTKLSNAARPLP